MQKRKRHLGFEKKTSSERKLINFLIDSKEEKKCKLRPCVPLTQLVELDFCELLDLTLPNVVIGYITRKFKKR